MKVTCDSHRRLDKLNTLPTWFFFSTFDFSQTQHLLTHAKMLSGHSSSSLFLYFLKIGLLEQILGHDVRLVGLAMFPTLVFALEVASAELGGCSLHRFLPRLAGGGYATDCGNRFPISGHLRIHALLHESGNHCRSGLLLFRGLGARTLLS